MPLDDAERNAAIRRALLVFAAGGGLEREPTLNDPAVLELARDLDSSSRREALAAAVEQLEAEPEALERLRDPETVERLRDPETAWRAYACALLADALGEE